MIAEIEKNEIQHAENSPDEIFPCLMCAREKKTGSLFFWSWPGSQEKFCQRCIPHPGTQHCEIFMLDLNEIFQWTCERISVPPKKEEPAPELPGTSQNLPQLAEEYFRCPSCRNLVSEFDVFDHACDPRVWQAW